MIVFSDAGDLVFDPAFGGRALNASYTYLPTGFGGTLAVHQHLSCEYQGLRFLPRICQSKVDDQLIDSYLGRLLHALR